METEIKKQFCPICKTEVKPSSRYPGYLCSKCAEKAVSTDGRPLEFFNESVSGGFVALFADSKEKYDSHICFVEGKQCFADEARFGGIVIQIEDLSLKDKIAGGLIGLLVGDALGVPYEFHDRQSIPTLVEIEFEPPDYFQRSHRGVPIGTYSDDGAQALILQNTLLECGKFDAANFAKGLIDWYEKGFFAVDDKVFDCGIQTARAIAKLKTGTKPILAGGADEYSNGNGSLMRVLPLALWHQGTDLELINDAFDQSAITHGHNRSKICCAIYCLWARGVLNELEKPWENAIETFYKNFSKNSNEILEFETSIIPKDAAFDIKGSGYVVDSFRAAHWLNEKFNNFEDVVKHAVAFGDDTDTTACIAGGIAGIKYGINEIPVRWRENLRGKELYQPLLEKLLASWEK